LVSAKIANFKVNLAGALGTSCSLLRRNCGGFLLISGIFPTISDDSYLGRCFTEIVLAPYVVAIDHHAGAPPADRHHHAFTHAGPSVGSGGSSTEDWRLTRPELRGAGHHRPRLREIPTRVVCDCQRGGGARHPEALGSLHLRQVGFLHGSGRGCDLRITPPCRNGADLRKPCGHKGSRAFPAGLSGEKIAASNLRRD
jgi:hypothetical protein